MKTHINDGGVPADMKTFCGRPLRKVGRSEHVYFFRTIAANDPYCIPCYKRAKKFLNERPVS